MHAINYGHIIHKVFHGDASLAMGPVDRPTWSGYYDLGNLPPYQYDLTLAQQILSKAHIDTTAFPTLDFRVLGDATGV